MKPVRPLSVCCIYIQLHNDSDFKNDSSYNSTISTFFELSPVEYYYGSLHSRGPQELQLKALE